MADSGDIRWITVHGVHIPLGVGESEQDAINRVFKNKKEDPIDKQEREIAERQAEKDKLNEDRKEKSTQDLHKEAVAELSKDKYEDGTYNINTLKTVDYDNGYQVTFCQIGDNYNAKDYDDRVNEFLSYSSDGRVLAGKFEGTPEISFHVSSKAEAIALAQKYNQISVWDWKNCDEIKTGGTGRR